MNGVSATSLVGLVAAREVMARLRDKGFLISTVVLLVIIAASSVLPALFSRDDGQAATVAAAAPAAEQLRDVEGLEVRQVADGAAAEGAVVDGTVDAALLVGPGGGLELVGDEELPDGLSRAVTDALLAAPVEQRLLDPPPPDEGLAILLSAGFSVLFFFTVFVFGLQIAQSVVEEKQSRVVELLVAAVPVRLLLAGKVAGNTALALGQIVLLVAVAMVGASLAGQARLLALLLQASGWFLLFFLLGFTMLACLWAVAGAVASRQEELQSTTLPLQMLVVLPFFAAIYVTEPGPALTVLSYLPVSSPLVMPRRILLGEVSAWEPLLAAAIIAVTAVLLVRVAAQLYEGSLLRIGTRTTLSQAWSSGRS